MNKIDIFIIISLSIILILVFGGMLINHYKSVKQEKEEEQNRQEEAERKAVKKSTYRLRDDPVTDGKDVYEGKSGKKYLIKKELGAGAEGCVYQIEGEYGLAAKLFNNHTELKQMREKLEWMTNRINQNEILTCTTWPKDLLFQKGDFCGYVMPRLSGGATLPAFMGPDYAYVGWNMRVLAALNLAIALDNIHSAGYICGDFQSRNIYVNVNKYNITVMDTDSFHIKTDSGRMFRCKVGNPEFLAPELLTRFMSERFDTMKEPTFTKQTDLFALAIHIFMLLMDSYHPFAGRLLPESEKDQYLPKKYENILAGKSYFFEKGDCFGTPMGAPSVNILPKEIQGMFQWTFQTGIGKPKERITAKQWKETLYRMKNTFAKCSQGHYYFSELKQCPWCHRGE